MSVAFGPRRMVRPAPPRRGSNMPDALVAKKRLDFLDVAQAWRP